MRETITIRLRRPKAELMSKAKPNLNAWINHLIDEALEPKPTDWDAVFERSRKCPSARYRSDEIRRLGR